jgi:CRP-like cAMP-binding protein
MDYKELVVRYITQHIQLDADEATYLESVLRVSVLKKKQAIVLPDFVCRYRSYIATGSMRAYLVDDQLQEHTIAFAIEDWWISDYASYIFQQPATLFVEALEDTVVVQIDYNAEQLLMETIPKCERFFRIITERSFAHLQQRMLSNLSKTAEQRYEEFLLKYPLIAARVPQYMLASYLGFSKEFLSKIRNKRVKKLN